MLFIHRNDWSEDSEDGLAVLHRKRQEMQEREQELQPTEAELIEQERIHDIKERQAFEDRLRSKDSKTSNISKLDVETLRKRELAIDKEARDQALPELREKSRQVYLKKREEQKLELLERRIKDEERLFKLEDLSEFERKELDYNKQVLKLAKDRAAIQDTYDGYKVL